MSVLPAIPSLCCHGFLIWNTYFAWGQACCSMKTISYLNIMQESGFFFSPLSLSHHFDFPIAMVFHHNCFSSFWNSHLFYELRVEHGGGGTHCFSPSMQTSYRFYLCQSHGWGDTHMYIYIFGVCEGAGIIIWIDFYVLLSWNIISLTVFKSFVLAKEKLNLKVCPMRFPFCAYHF